MSSTIHEKKNISCPIVASTSISDIVIGKSSLGHAFFKNLWNLHIYEFDHFYVLTGKNARDPCVIFDFSNEPCSYEFIYLSFYFWKYFRPILSFCLFHRCKVILYGEMMDSDFWVQSRHFFISPSKDVSILIYSKSSMVGWFPFYICGEASTMSISSVEVMQTSYPSPYLFYIKVWSSCKALVAPGIMPFQTTQVGLGRRIRMGQWRYHILLSASCTKLYYHTKK